MRNTGNTITVDKPQSIRSYVTATTVTPDGRRTSSTSTTVYGGDAEQVISFLEESIREKAGALAAARRKRS